MLQASAWGRMQDLKGQLGVPWPLAVQCVPQEIRKLF